MVKIKNIFKKEQIRLDVSEEKKKEREIKLKLDEVFKDKRNKVCKKCEKRISSTEKYSKVGGYFFHRPCLKDVKKIAKQGGHI